MLGRVSTKGDGSKDVAHKPGSGERAPVFPFAIASLCVVGWIVCFAAGAVINSQPYRDYLNRAANLEILASQSGSKAPKVVAAAAKETAKASDGAKGETAALTREEVNRAVADAIKAQAPAELPKQTTGAYVEEGLADLFSVFGILSMFIVVVTFTPPNLALLGALAAVAGAAGRWMMDGVSKAEEAALGEPQGHSASTATLRKWASTMMLSALSRGFFVYLAMLSGLLVLTGDPFDKPSAGQYVRLAGTCSLFCFIVGWQPELLKSIIAKFITRVVPEQTVEAKTTVTKATVVTQSVEAKSTVAADAGAVNGKDTAKGAGREKVETV